MKTKAVYAGSFDPFTMGHLWVFLRAAALFDEIVIAVGKNPSKKHTFSAEDRMDMINKTLNLWPHDSCGNFHGAQVVALKPDPTTGEEPFLVDYAREIGCTHIVRGLRDQDDFRDEKRFMNLGLYIQGHHGSERIIDTVYIITPKELEETSSGAVKMMCGLKGWELAVHGMVPPPVFDVLKLWVAGGKL